MNITKSAPLPERPCEQLTCCEKIGSVQGNYINCVKKRHNCRITGKEKATCHGGPSTQISRYPQRMSIADNATFTAGGQGYQPGGRFLVAFNRRGYLSTKSSRANFSGGTKRGAGGGIFVLVSSSSTLAQASDCLCRMISSSCVCVSCIGDSVLLVMILPCKAMRRSSSRHGADSYYSDSWVLRRWSSSRAMVTSCPISSAALTPIFSTCASASSEETRGFSPLPSAWRRAISPRTAVTIKFALVSPGCRDASMPLTTSCGNLALSCCDLLLTELVDMFAPPINSGMQCNTKVNTQKSLKWYSLKCNLNTTRADTCNSAIETMKPRTVGAVTGLLTNNVN